MPRALEVIIEYGAPIIPNLGTSIIELTKVSKNVTIEIIIEKFCFLIPLKIVNKKL